MESEPVLPAGLEPVPGYGPDAVGARLQPGWITRSTVFAIALAVIGALVLVSGISAGSGAAVVIVLAATALIWGAAVNYLLLIRLRDRPILVIDGDTIHLMAPLNRARVRLSAVTAVKELRRDLLVKAPGGIVRHGRATRAVWVDLTQANSLTVGRGDLLDYLRARAEVARAGAGGQ